MLRRLSLRDYRNFAAAELVLGDRFTVLFGHNGAGKTNVLEAVYLVATLRSFRVPDLAPLVRRDQARARVEVEAEDPVAGVPARLVVRLDRHGSSVRRTAEADGKTIRRASDFYGRVRAILFTPEDLAVLRGGPSARRQLVDRMVFARDRQHIADTQSYDKVLRSRNHVLKQDVAGPERARLLDSYDVQLATLGGRIWSRRRRILDELRPHFLAAFAAIHGTGPEASVEYVSRLEERDGAVPDGEEEVALAAMLSRRRSDDLQRGVTTAGPHRDELDVQLDGRPAASHASQGQTRALILALKLAELRAARTRDTVAPLLLLDDVSSELDPQRSEQLFAALWEDAGQCLLTTTERRFAALPEAADPTLLEVESGVVRSVAGKP